MTIASQLNERSEIYSPGQKEGYFCKKGQLVLEKRVNESSEIHKTQANESSEIQKHEPMKVVKSIKHDPMKVVKSKKHEPMKVVKSKCATKPSIPINQLRQFSQMNLK